MKTKFVRYLVYYRRKGGYPNGNEVIGIHTRYRFLVRQVSVIERETRHVWGLCGGIFRKESVKENISPYRMLSTWHIL